MGGTTSHTSAPSSEGGVVMSALTEHLKEREAEARAEIAACADGTWPRDLNDLMRWIHLPDTREAQWAYVVRCRTLELESIERCLNRENV